MLDKARKPGVLLRHVNVLSFAQHRWPVDVDSGEDFNLGYSVDFGTSLDSDQHVIAVKTHIGLLLTNEEQFTEEDPYTLADLETLVLFDLVEEDDVDRNQPIVLDFVANVLGIAYSTTRGVLIGRMSTKRIEEFPPPAVSPRKIVREMNLDWVFDPDAVSG